MIVGTSRGHNRDIQPLSLGELIVVQLRKNQPFVQSHGVIAVPVEGSTANPSEVTHPRKNDTDESVQKLVHPLAPQRNFATDGYALSKLETCDRIACECQDWLLASDLAHRFRREFQELLVLHRLANPHIDRDLLNLGNREHILNPQLFAELILNVVYVKLL